MAHQADCTAIEGLIQQLSQHGLEKMGDAIRTLLNEAMKLERTHALQAQPFQRTQTRQSYANGFKPKTVATRLGPLTFDIPQVRGDLEFYPSALERGVRSERALKLAIAEMYVPGVSTRKVTAVLQQLCGLEVSSTQVSQATARLDEELEGWRTRSLGEIAYLLLAARYEKVRHGGSVVSCAVLMAVGITPEGQRIVLGVSVSLSEAEVHWRTFLATLQDRGMHGIRMIDSQIDLVCFPLFSNFN